MRRLIHRPRRCGAPLLWRNLVRENAIERPRFRFAAVVNEKLDERGLSPAWREFLSCPKTKLQMKHAALTTWAPSGLAFGIPEHKDEQASGAYQKWNHQKALRAIKQSVQIWSPSRRLPVRIHEHGHCGVTRMDGDHFHVLNDESVELLVKNASLTSRGQTCGAK